MDASQPIYLQAQAIRNMWRETWWNMAGGVKSEYDRIKKTDVFEFWKLFDLWRAGVEKERELYKQKTQQNGRK